MYAITADKCTDAKVTVAPRSNSATGYGGKIPTGYMLKTNNRWHRVYMMQYGNSGSPYVLIGGKVHHLSGSAELVLETVRDGGTFADAMAKLMEWPQWVKDSEQGRANHE